MRKEFFELVEIMIEWHLFQKDDEVDVALTNLSNKIDEVEKRIECAVRSAREINQFVSKYTEDVDNHQPINMSVNDHDFILNRSSDVDIALDMGEKMCVSDNWYNLFSPKESEETHTIVNCLDCGHPQPLLEENIHVDSVGRYMVCEQCENQFNVDLSEVFMTFHSSWGEIDCDKDGNVIEVRGDEYIGDERNYLFDIEHFDLVEFGKFCESKNITMGEAEDIISVGFWKYGGEYCEAEKDFRKEIFGEAPTMLCVDSDKHKIVNNIISQLKAIDVDGETMEYILKQVGMDEQMLKELFAQSTNDEIDYLHDVRNGKG